MSGNQQVGKCDFGAGSAGPTGFWLHKIGCKTASKLQGATGKKVLSIIELGTMLGAAYV